MGGGLCKVEGYESMLLSCTGEAVGEDKGIDEGGEGGCSGGKCSGC